MKKQTVIHMVAGLMAICLLCGSLAGCGVKAPFIPSERAVAGQELYTFGSYTYQLYAQIDGKEYWSEEKTIITNSVRLN